MRVKLRSTGMRHSTAAPLRTPRPGPRLVTAVDARRILLRRRREKLDRMCLAAVTGAALVLLLAT